MLSYFILTIALFSRHSYPQMKKMKQREAREPAQGQIINELQSWDSNPGWLNPNTELSP